MEVDDWSYQNIDADQFSDSKPPETNHIIVKKTLIPSPIILNIFPSFNVCTEKPFRGLSSLSLNDEEYQTLIPPENNSQLDAFSDDENDVDLFPSNESQDTSPKQNEGKKLESVKLIVKLKSILIDNIEFKTNAEIRCATVVRGKRDLDGSSDEDSLFISLKSGFLLLIRLFLVPCYYKDSDYIFQATHVRHNGTSIFKPFVVQWWDVSNELSVPSLETSGYQLASDNLGSSVVSTSAYRSFRIYNTEPTSNGIMMKKHFNVGVDGLILHSCFEAGDETTFSTHASFLTLIYTDHHRLCLQLFSWSSNTNISEQNLSKTTLPLDNTFRIPIFIVPLKVIGGFLFVLEDELIIVTVHQIISAEYSFKRFGTPWTRLSFPTNYYVPNSHIVRGNEVEDEILISTDSGLIYSVQLNKSCDIHIRPILRITASISLFTLERFSSGFSLIFGSDSDDNQELFFSDLFPEEYVNEVESHAKLKYIGSKVVKNFPNWSPLLDVEIIESSKTQSTIPYCTDELWGLTGNGKRSKITQFRFGYSAGRKSKIYEKLRKCSSIYQLFLYGVSYLLCSFSFHTLLLEYQCESSYTFSEIENVKISEQTLFATTLTFKDFVLVMYITPTRISITNFTDYTLTSEMENKVILMSKVENGYLVLVTEEVMVGHVSKSIEVFSIDRDFDGRSGSSLSQVITSIRKIQISYEPSLLFLTQIQEETCMVTGSYTGELFLYTLSNLENVRQLDLRSFSPYKYNSPFSTQSLIPNDVALLDKTLYIGTKDGFLVSLNIQNDMNCSRFLRLSDSPIRFSSNNGGDSLLFIYSKSIWLLNLRESSFPERVFFEETFERTVLAVTRLPYTHGSGRMQPDNLAIIRDDGLMVVSIFPFKEPNLRHVSIMERAHKISCFFNSSLFIILCKSKNPNGRLRFIDKKTLKSLPHWEMKLKSKESEEESIFDQNEIPTASCIWSVKRENRISKKLLIGCASEGTNQNSKFGSIKVLDISKSKDAHSTSIRVLELTSFNHPYPITHIKQVDDVILFTSGSRIYCTSYDAQNKKLKVVTCLKTLSSDITWLDVKDGFLLVTTKFDSVFQFSYSSHDGRLDLRIAYSDPCTNSYVNHTRIGSHIFAGDKLHSSISIMNDDAFSARTTFRVSCIARVFTADFRCSWELGRENIHDKDRTVLCVGVNGEIFFVRLVASNDTEVHELAIDMNKAKLPNNVLKNTLEKLNVPFMNKVSGTGLFSINKPSYDYAENKNTLIDYDLDDISNFYQIDTCI